MKSFAESHNEFALGVYDQLFRTPGNLFFSPFSIRAALGMAYAGARGVTASQMRDALRFASQDEDSAAFAEIITRLNAAGGGAYDMRVANSLWGQEGAPLRTGFLDLIGRHYGGAMNLVDFRQSAEAARILINQWVEDRTRQKIRDFIASGGVSALTRLVLINAVYFKGLWMLPFNKAATRDEPFFLEGGSKVQAALMHLNKQVRYMEEGFQAVDLDYRGGDISLLVALPDRKNGLQGLESRLSARMLGECVSKMRARDVKLFLPRFKMSFGTVDLADCLRGLGMLIAFSSARADFSGINGHWPPHAESLFISAVLHKACVEVNEEGTEAAAATGVVAAPGAALRPTPPPVPIFRADHPFVYAIRDKRSGAILFLGRVADPTREI